jgi:CRISPR-associated protein Cmr2
MTQDFVAAIAACLAYQSDVQRTEIEALARRVLLEQPDAPTKEKLQALQQEIDQGLQSCKHTSVSLVYGGATRIKEYVFEAPKLPEIRGASALLDWVNERGLRKLWIDDLKAKLGDAQLADHCVVYASGGNILAFASASEGERLAGAIERCYTETTLTANSVAVAGEFSLLELRYGRLCYGQGNKIRYWVDEFLRDWKDRNDERKQKALAEYYYAPDGVDPNDMSDEALSRRFFHRKTFGELVTVLATRFNRRRDERATYGEPRSPAFYPLLPWAAKCDSSDVRPAVWRGPVADEQREMSEASARKRYVGQVVKQEAPRVARLEKDLAWKLPEDLRRSSWEQQWNTYLDDNGDRPYAQALPASNSELRPPRDLNEIGMASRGYIGVIYADGNNVGRLIATLNTPQIYAETSRRLSSAAKDAVFGALSRHLVPVKLDDASTIHPFEILTIGGDDLMLIVPANRALDITLSLGYHFEQKLGKNEARQTNDRYCGEESNLPYAFSTYRPEIGLSAGLLIAQQNAPIFFLRDLVEELLKSAKALAKKNAQRGDLGGAVDFMVMKSITMVTDKIKAFRRAALGDDTERRLTARPYTWHELAGLVATVQALRAAGVPRSQLYRLRNVLNKEPGPSTITSTMEYLYTRVRLASTSSQALTEHVEHNWRSVPTPSRLSGPPIPPWLTMSEGGFETIWPDLVEMYEMVEQ